MEKFTTIAKAKELTGLAYFGNINASSKMMRSKEFSPGEAIRRKAGKAGKVGGKKK